MTTTPTRPAPNRRARAQIAVYLLRREKAALDAIVAERQAEEIARDPRAKFSITAWIVEHIRADAAARGIEVAADSEPPTPEPESKPKVKASKPATSKPATSWKTAKPSTRGRSAPKRKS